MSAVRVESILVVRKKERTAGVIVPVSVIAIMLVLVIISALTGRGDNTTLWTEISKVFQHIALPQIKAPSLSGLNLPGLAIYISLGIFVLWIFDLFLGKIFFRRQ
jgi:multisubunit Na+/H+ antiporter MnhB subunit